MTRHSRPWTAEEDAVVREAKLDKDAAVLLGRTVRSVRGRRERLGFQRGRALLNPMLPNPRSLLPWVTNNRTVLAKSCTGCGLLLDAEWFPRRRRQPYPNALKPSCIRCTNDNSYQYQRERERRRASHQVDMAPRSGTQWTSAEDDLICRSDLSVLDMAKMLGRTYEAVHSRRRRVQAPSLAIQRVEPVVTWVIDRQVVAASARQAPGSPGVGCCT